ncbi:MAG: 1-(5-phosphoribosyl)-5-[(5-phosphoribosylamino)methylideneamino]imidazole-4-carboxamide isomerase [Bacteroidetes bacterium]|nr:1-(5-phosphoribosyl)-5-[(5-phosphoribosylamino)methylideneamino]imidazole-4-carboxamide isomerase [Bacteroidota bacterium]MCY4233138.1 1-(5-phosphoribosyl)-5-[(5-phosphoribosylamino)methylideneamino]imidazole-4-carboxamide isomerase [Bacteroidota bacterium]
MIIPVPAIDLLEGNCVRLLQGAYDQVTHYHANPLQVAQMWEDQGAPMVHIVDLDAARSGGSVNNSDTITHIAKHLSIPIQTGGGIRSKEDVIRLLDQGIHRVIIGTAAVKDRELVRDMVLKYGDQHVAVGIDAKQGEVRVSGWIDGTGLSAVEFAQDMERCGVRRIIYTDIGRDGTMLGPNLNAYQTMGTQLTTARLMASGGVSGPEDLDTLNELVPFGVDSVIIGRALYEKKFSGYQLWNQNLSTCP